MKDLLVMFKLASNPQIAPRAVAIAAGLSLCGSALSGGPNIPSRNDITSNINFASKASEVGKFNPRELRTQLALNTLKSIHPRRLIVKFKDKSLLNNIQSSSANPRLTAKKIAFPESINSFMTEFNASTIAAYPELGLVVFELNDPKRRILGTTNDLLEAQLHNAKKLQLMRDRFLKSGLVEYAEFDQKVQIQATPNDPSFGQLWGLHNTGQVGGTPDSDIDAPEGWNVKTGSAANVVIGVVDTGIDYNHRDLATNMWKNPSEIPSNGIDDDNNGYIDDVYGIDTYNYDSDPWDDHSHGTHVAGTIGAKGNNSLDVVGVNWNAKLMALKFIGYEGWGYTSGAIELINYVIDLKNRYNLPRIVLNNSWGGSGYSQALYDAFAAAEKAGILSVVAAGNNSEDTEISPHYPAAFDLPSIISVGASSMFESKAWFSNYGCQSVDLMAPGEGILSTVPNDSLAIYDGTSMASPHAAGVAALIWSKNPTWGWRAVKGALLNGVDAKAQYKEIVVTGGRLNLKNSLDAAVGGKPAVFAVTPNYGNAGDEITIDGSSFGATPGAVLIGGVAATVTSWTYNKITAKIPSGVPKSFVKLHVKRADGSQSRAGACFDNSVKAVIYDRMLVPRLAHGGALVGDNYWVFGGWAGVDNTDIVERINLKTKRKVIDSAWSLPSARENVSAVSLGGKIYIFGGFGVDDQGNTGILSDTLIFNPSTGAWTRGASMPEGREGAAAVRMPNGKIYLFGGVAIGSDGLYYETKTTYIYDPKTDTWSQGADSPFPHSYSPATASPVTNEAWIGRNYAYRYDASTDSWEEKGATACDHTYGVAAWYKSTPNITTGFCEKAEYWDATTSKWNVWGVGPTLLYATSGIYNGALLTFGGGLSDGWWGLTPTQNIYEYRR